MPEPERQQREVFFRGRVQGVGFRYTARSLAMGFEVAGYVKNLSDGRVQLVAEGSPHEVARFLDAVKAELGRYIEDTQELRRPASGRFASFEIRH